MINYARGAKKITALVITTLLAVFYLNFIQTKNELDFCISNDKPNLFINRSGKDNFQLKCSLNLDKNDVIEKTIVINQVSNIKINCQGAKINGLYVHSFREKEKWFAPQNIIIDNCHFTAPVRIYGLGRNGEALPVLQSSHLDKNHTARAQSIAPKNIEIKNSIFDSNSGIPLYLAPGVTNIKIVNNLFQGSSTSTAIYLDAESGHNILEKNKFTTITQRELIAIDGSAHNIIKKNIFHPSPNRSAIHIYRNCGEGGTVRHQIPSNNKILENQFVATNREAIHVGSRSGRRNYCQQDEGIFNEGINSSLKDHDYANDNLIASNIFVLPLSEKKYISRIQLVVRGENNTISNNKFISYQPNLSCTTYIKAYGIQNLKENTCLNKFVKPPASQHEFSCQVSSNNSGCQNKFSCPRGKKIVGIKAGCNLESSSVSNSALRSIKDNTLSVIRASDFSNQGRCQIENTIINQGTTSLAAFIGDYRISFSCQEHDKNGGDCQIKGIVTCQ